MGLPARTCVLLDMSSHAGGCGSTYQTQRPSHSKAGQSVNSPKWATHGLKVNKSDQLFCVGMKAREWWSQTRTQFSSQHASVCMSISMTRCFDRNQRDLMPTVGSGDGRCGVGSHLESGARAAPCTSCRHHSYTVRVPCPWLVHTTFHGHSMRAWSMGQLFKLPTCGLSLRVTFTADNVSSQS